MPLLGRHKSSSSTAGQRATTTTGDRNNQQVCESPLFGTRRQLPLGNTSPEQHTRTSSSNKSSPTRSSPTARTGQPSGNLSPDEAGELLSSIPQQITRQQIHYAFSIMDLNKDGMIDVRDLSQMLANLGVPIDEAILSHIMSKLSKRGDHRISEGEFLDWISNFIQISDNSPKQSTETSNHKSSRRVSPTQASGSSSRVKTKVARSSTTGAASLIAESPNEIPRTRRGSGSGLALMRSLSAGSTTVAMCGAGTGRKESPSSYSSRSLSSTSQLATEESGNQVKLSEVEDQKNDLKAAFLVFDVDGDGFITLDEVRAGLKLLGESWTPAEVRQVFSGCKSSSSSELRGSSPSRSQRINIDDFVQLLL